MDLRERVVAAVEAGESRRSAARRFGVSESVAVKWLQRVANTGSVKPGKMGGHRRPALDGERDWILGRVAEQPDITLKALMLELGERGTKVSLYAVWSFFQREGLTVKKNPARRRAGSAGRGAQTGPVAASPGGDRSAPAGLHR
jgi:putative transposase